MTIIIFAILVLLLHSQITVKKHDNELGVKMLTIMWVLLDTYNNSTY